VCHPSLTVICDPGHPGVYASMNTGRSSDGFASRAEEALSEQPTPWRFWAGAALIGGLAFLVFLPAIRNGFVNFDDAKNFLRNPNYRGLGWANLRWMFTTPYTGHYIPVTWLTLGLDYVLWGMNPAGYHLTSVVLHSANAVLVYLLSYRLLGAGFEGRGSTGSLSIGAAVAALVWAIHPLRVESVAWVTERRDVVAGFFSLLAVLAYLGAHRHGNSGRLDARRYWTAVGLFGPALLSKSIVVGLPLVLLVLDWYPLRRTAVGAKHLLLEKLPFLLMSAAVSAFMLRLGARQELMTTLDALGIGDRLAVSAYGLGFYLWKTLVPWPLSPFYELHFPIAPFALRYLLPGMSVLAITVGLIVLRHRAPAGLGAWTAYIILLLPVIGVFHNGYQVAADRYTYLASLGWALVTGAGVSWCVEAGRSGAITPRLARLCLALAATVIVALAGLTTLQIRVWRNSETLWRHALAVDPRSANAHFHLAGALLGQGKAPEARAEYEQAVSLLSDSLPNAKAVFYASLGSLLQGQGDVAGAEQNYRAALRFSEDNVLARSNLGVIQAGRGELREALNSFLRVLRVMPGFPPACEGARRTSEVLGVRAKELETCSPITAGG
jgi:protein O-mannosyl-transferase